MNDGKSVRTQNEFIHRGMDVYRNDDEAHCNIYRLIMHCAIEIL